MARRRRCRTPPSALGGTDSATRRGSCATSRRFRESVHQLQVWFGQEGSPAAAQFVENPEAGRRRPDSADFQDAERASCSARRSSSVRSSPSSSATRSTTVPSGSVVGSSRTSRPFSTRARRRLMGPLKGFLDGQQEVRLHAEGRRFVEAVATWFQLAGIEGRQYSYALFRRAFEQTSIVAVEGVFTGWCPRNPSCWWTPGSTRESRPRCR